MPTCCEFVACGSQCAFNQRRLRFAALRVRSSHARAPRPAVVRLCPTRKCDSTSLPLISICDADEYGNRIPSTTMDTMDTKALKPKFLCVLRVLCGERLGGSACLVMGQSTGS